MNALDHLFERIAGEELADRLFDEFRAAYEADPYQEADTARMALLVAEHGDYASGYLWGRLTTYLQMAPEPKRSPEQLAALRERADRVFEKLRRKGKA